MKIVFYETTQEDQASLETLLSQNKILAGAETNFFTDTINSTNLAAASDADVIGIFYKSLIHEEQLARMPQLKLIATMSTGFDHIDLAAAASRGVAVANVPAYGSRTVAEFTFALMLGLSRKTFAAYRQLKEGLGFTISQFEGFNLQGKTLGIVGTGRIGQNVAKIAKGFDMRVLAFDAYPNQQAAAEIGFSYLPLPELLGQSDIVTLHVPYSKDTHHLINSNNIANFKKGALLINTSRGEVVETEAILHGIQQGILAGVGLDVIEGERQLMDEWSALSEQQNQTQLKTLMEDHLLIGLPQVAYTPHIAFFTKEAKQEILNTTVENMASWIAGTPKNLIKP